MSNDWPKAIEIEPGIGRYADVANAIDKGEPAKAHALLRARLADANSAEETQRVRELLDHPVLFAIPITKGPGLGRVNGIGTGLYGRRDVPGADGAYVATRCFSFAWIPLVPIDRYVVRDADGGGWYFLARLPVSGWQRGVRTVALIALLIGVAAIGLAVWKTMTTDDVHVLNGLDVPVDVTIGETALHVPPGGRAQTSLRAGEHFLRCTGPDGRVLDEQNVRVDGGHDLVVYNPLGAAPLYTLKVLYGSAGRSRSDPVPHVLAGRGWMSMDRVDHVFEEAPDSVSDEPGRDTSRTIAAVENGGWRTSINWLVQRNESPLALKVAQRVADAFPDQAEPFIWAVVTASEHGSEQDLVRVAEARFALLPDEVEAHRQYQAAFEQIGRQNLVEPRYRLRSEGAPGDADAAYLLARILPLGESIPMYERVLLRDPGHLWSRRGLAWAYYQSERFEDALPLFDTLPSTDPHASVQPVELRVRCLAGLGRMREALEVARSAAAQVGPDDTYALSLMRLYARAHALGGSPGLPPGELIQQRLGEDIASEDVVWVLAQAASSAELEEWMGRVGNPIWREWAALTKTARTQPEQLPSLAGVASQQAVNQLAAAAVVALVCELCRTDEFDTAQLVYLGIPAHVRTRLSFELLRDLDQVSAVDAEVDLEIRAVLWDAKARRTQDAAQSSVWRERAHRLDTLRCVVPR